MDTVMAIGGWLLGQTPGVGIGLAAMYYGPKAWERLRKIGKAVTRGADPDP